MASLKPLVLISVTPVYGHLMPIRAIGKELIARGYEVTFVTGSPYKKLLEDIGASHVPLEGDADFTEADADTERFAERKTIPSGIPQFLWDMENVFIKSIPAQHQAQQKGLKMLQDRHPGRPIVLVSEGFFFGSIATYLDAPGIKPTATLGLGIIPMTLGSIDTAPFGPGLPPDSSPEGRERNKAMYAGLGKMFEKPTKRFQEVLKEVGAKETDIFFLDAQYLGPDRFLQMCTPSVEYPRSDAPASIKFAGGLPKGHRDPFTNPPSWWGEIINNKTKKIILVSQGSVAMNFSNLVIPTMEGLKDREDIITVVALGRKGAELPSGTPVPSNARVADFVPFDEVLPHCAVFITNGGYGAFQHAISNGTPLIVAGNTEDKPEVAQRAEWSGFGLNLRTETPSPELVLKSVDEIVLNDKFKKRALELEAEMESFDPIGVVAQTIDDLAAGKHKV